MLFEAEMDESDREGEERLASSVWTRETRDRRVGGLSRSGGMIGCLYMEAGVSPTPE